MSDASETVQKIMQNKDNYEESGLVFSDYGREWTKFNLLVGRNGSGKSRVLQMIKNRARGKGCKVIYMDFAGYILAADKMKEGAVALEEGGLEDDELAEMLIFNKLVDDEIFLDFLKYLHNQILRIFDDLFDLGNDRNKLIRKQVKEILDKLNPSIEDILHKNIIVNEDGIYLCRENRSIRIEEEWCFMSPGERSILAIILAILLIKLIKEPCILLIDEMETHLHPEAQVKLYKLLKQALEKSETDNCTCIASHSIFLLPLFKIQEIVYMNNGEIEKINGVLYQQVYDDLTGEGDKKEESLTDFLYSMSAWQYADYLAQCFLEPTTVDSASNKDEQALKFIKVLECLYDKKEKIEVLDFGAGTARIGECIEYMLKESTEILALASRLTYHVYDPNTISSKFKKNTAWRGNAYGSEEELISDVGKFDIILLYNVLHEISVDEWVKELNLIFNLLTKEGILLFGEREILSVGENPYGKSGYLVLGKDELIKLFPGVEIDEISLPKKQREVTACFAVKKPEIKGNYIRKEEVRSALECLKNNTREKIKNRQRNGLGKRGKSREYAFYCQQYVNAEEAIEILNGQEEKQKKMKENQGFLRSKNVKLADLIQLNISQKEKIEKIKELAQENTEDGLKAKKYLECKHIL